MVDPSTLERIDLYRDPDTGRFLARDPETGKTFGLPVEDLQAARGEVGVLKTNEVDVQGGPVKNASSVETEVTNINKQPGAIQNGLRKRDRPSTIGRVLRFGAWTWFNKPVASYANGMTVIGAIQRSGNIDIGSVNHQTGERAHNLITTGFEGDDHNNPAVIIRDDGHILVVYQDHGQSDTIYYRISSNPYDITSFGAEQTLTAPGTSSTYAQVTQLSAEGATYLFYRDERSSSTALSFYRSTDGGQTWSGPTALIETSASSAREYWRIGSNGSDRIDIGLTKAEGGNTNPHVDVKHVYLTGQSVYASDGTQLASFSDTDPLTSHAAATMIYDSSAAGNSDAWIWDCESYNGMPAVVYAELVSNTDHNWRYARWTDSGWQDESLADAGGRVTDPSVSIEGFYSAGASLDPGSPGTVYFAAGDDVSSSLVLAERSGVADSWRYQQVAPAEKQNIRPAVPWSPDGPSDELPVVWMHGYYHDFVGLDDGYQTTITGGKQEHEANARLTLGSANPTEQTIATGSLTEVSFDYAPENNIVINDPSNNAIIVPDDGVYSINCQIYYNALSAAALCSARLQRNGNGFQILDRQSADAGSDPVLNGVVQSRLNAGDEIKVLTEHDSGSNESIKSINPTSGQNTLTEVTITKLRQ